MVDEEPGSRYNAFLVGAAHPSESLVGPASESVEGTVRALRAQCTCSINVSYSNIEQMTTLHRNYRRATWFAVGVYLIVCLTTLNYNGPFFDEAIYVTGGIRTLEGFGYTDRYLTWFSGSLAWPLLAALGYLASGLTGTRAVAALLVTSGLGAFSQAVRNLFGAKTSFWATLALAINGAFFSLSRLGVYDTLAILWITVSFWAVTQLAQQDHRRWLVVSAVAYTFAIFAKYPIGLMGLPLVGTIVFLRRDRASIDVLLFAFIAGALGLSIFLPMRQQVAEFFVWTFERRPPVEVPTRLIAINFAYLSAIPLVLAVVGWLALKGKRWLASVMVLSLVIWPTYHLLTGDPISSNKHLVFGYLFAYPLVGVALSEMWGDGGSSLLRRGLVVIVILVMVGVGVLQVTQANNSWPDARPAAAFLVDRVQPGDRLLISESWPYTMYLYTGGHIDSPWDVYDEYRIDHEEDTPGVCEYDWFVDTRGTFAFSEEILDQKATCESYEEVFSSTSYVISLGASATYVSHPVETTVWKNIAE